MVAAIHAECREHGIHAADAQQALNLLLYDQPLPQEAQQVGGRYDVYSSAPRNSIEKILWELGAHLVAAEGARR